MIGTSNIGRDSMPLAEQKKFNKVVEEQSSEFWNLEERINSDNLIFISPKLKEEVKKILVIIKI